MMDHPGLPQLIIILVYLGLLLALGLFSSRLFKGTKEDYQVASHSIGPFLLLMSIFGTTMTAFAWSAVVAKRFVREWAFMACLPAAVASFTRSVSF